MPLANSMMGLVVVASSPTRQGTRVVLRFGGGLSVSAIELASRDLGAWSRASVSDCSHALTRESMKLLNPS